MNIYILVEGRSTEKKLYPKFVDYFFDGKLTKVSNFMDVTENNYFLLSGNGYPRIFTDVLRDSILDINSIDRYDYLFLCIDADENSIEERQLELNRYLEQFKDQGVEINPKCKIELIVQNRCIETWFLGNKSIYKRNPSSEILVQYQRFYNVQHQDPELMSFGEGFDNHANFHFSYLREMLLERNIRYTKKNPRGVAEDHYLDRLIERGEDKKHIQSFMSFVNLCSRIKKQIK